MRFTGYFVTFVVAVAVSVALSIVGVLALSGHTGLAVDQGTVCVASTDVGALECPEGGLFMARLSLSEQDVQNPLRLESRLLNTMALYCDTNHEIQRTQTGVICVLTHERLNVPANNTSEQGQ